MIDYVPMPICCACDKDYDLHIFLHNRSGTPIVFCVTCASHEMARASSRNEYTYQGVYTDISQRVVDRYLDEAYEGLSPRGQAAADSMQTPYDQAMATYYEEAAGYTSQQLQDRRADTLELDTWYNMPSDAVLDKYIDAHPDKFTYVAYADNTEDNEAAGYRQWYDLRQSAIGG